MRKLVGKPLFWLISGGAVLVVWVITGFVIIGLIGIVMMVAAGILSDINGPRGDDPLEL